MSRKVRRGTAPILLLGFLRGILKRSRSAIWFQLNLRRWAKSNNLSYPTALKALHVLAAEAGDLVPSGRESEMRALPEWAAENARQFKFRCIQVKTCTNARFIWHFAPLDRLEWDQEPLFYRSDRRTSRHVRCQLRSVDIATDALEATGQYKTSPSLLIKGKEVQPSTTPAGPGCSESAPEKQIAANQRAKKLQTCTLIGENALRRKAYALLPDVQEIHENSTGRVPFSPGHAVGYLLSALKLGYAEKTVLRCYRLAHEIATACVVDRMVRKSPLALLLGVARKLLHDQDKLSADARIEAFYARRVEGARFHAELLAGPSKTAQSKS